MIIGAHISLAKGIIPGLTYAQNIGLDCFQFFSSAPQQWKSCTWERETYQKFVDECHRYTFSPLYVHGSYLINLATDNPTLLSKSIVSLRSDLEFLSKIGGNGLIFHFGSHPGGWLAKRKTLIPLLLDILNNSDPNVSLIIENSAGSGKKIGARLEELQHIQTDINSSRLQFCLDTAHAFAAGYDISHPDSIESFVTQVEKTIGWESVEVIHLNESKAPLASFVDRHANIGEGYIGLDAIGYFINHPRLRHKPLILETPGFDGHGPDLENISRVRRLIFGDD